jgi:hypothetical protein
LYMGGGSVEDREKGWTHVSIGALFCLYLLGPIM